MKKRYLDKVLEFDIKDFKYLDYINGVDFNLELEDAIEKALPGVEFVMWDVTVDRKEGKVIVDNIIIQDDVMYNKKVDTYHKAAEVYIKLLKANGKELSADFDNALMSRAAGSAWIYNDDLEKFIKEEYLDESKEI